MTAEHVKTLQSLSSNIASDDGIILKSEGVRESEQVNNDLSNRIAVLERQIAPFADSQQPGTSDADGQMPAATITAEDMTAV